MIGNTAQKVNAYSKASVLIVKPTDENRHLREGGQAEASAT